MGERVVRAPQSRLPGVFIEPLETRRLMAIIDVTAAPYNANPADNGTNDLNGIQAAINASHDWDTILFPGGTYNLSFSGSQGDGLLLIPKRIYKGINGAKIKGKAGNGQLLTIKGNDVTVLGLTLEGGGMFMDKPGGGKNQNIIIDNNVFNTNSASGAHRSGIKFTSGLQNSRISNNYFTGYVQSFAIYGQYYNNLTIANNEFVNVQAAMHIDALQATDNANLLVEQNYVSGAKGMGYEFQSRAHDLIFQDNWYEHPNLSTVRTVNNGTMAFSLILDKAYNITIRRNVVIAPERPDGKGCRIGFEVGGDNTLVEDNYVNGINHVLAMNDGEGTASVVARNNKFLNYLQGPSNTFPSTNPLRTLTLINNGPNTHLSATMEARIAAMQKPGIGAKRYGPLLPDPDPEPDPEPPLSPPAAPTDLTVLNTVDGDVVLSWRDNSATETNYIIQRLGSDNVTWETVDTLGQDTTHYTVQNLESGHNYSFRVLAQNASGFSDPSNIAVFTQPPAAPSNLAAVTVGANQIDLSWTDNSSNEAVFYVQLLGDDGSTWLTVGIVGANTTNFSITGVTAGKSYSFRVLANNDDGFSTPSNQAEVKTPQAGMGTSTAWWRWLRPTFLYQGSSAASPPTPGAS